MMRGFVPATLDTVIGDGDLYESILQQPSQVGAGDCVVANGDCYVLILSQ